MTFKSRSLQASLAVFIFIGVTGCETTTSTSSTTPSTASPTKISGCAVASTGSTWVPNVTNASNANHNANVTVSSTTVSKSAPLYGLADNVSGHEVTVGFTVPSDLGANGSVTLTAQVTNAPASVTDGVFPVLTYLSDGTNEYVNLPRDVSGNLSCGQFFTCSNGRCDFNAPCSKVGYPSAYTDFNHYSQHQFQNWGAESVNRFPTCKWTEGNSATPYDPSVPVCAFNTYLAGTAGHLPVGNYTAKYVLLTNGFSSIGGVSNATLNVTVTEKADTVDSAVGGAVDVNVVLVGSKNIGDSHTVEGQRNLNTLFHSFGQYLNVPNAAIKVGKINVYELSCAQGGDALATISFGNLGQLLQNGSAAIGASTEGKALNIFLISEFSDSSAVLGISGAIGAPPVNGLQTSGLVFATFDSLKIFNPGCNATPCPITAQDPDFYEMGNTIAHEAGHFLGLSHPSEFDGQTHDPVYDTPICTATDNLAGGRLSISSCLNSDTNVFPASGKTCSQACGAAGGYNSSTGTFCSAVPECAFNHMMWYQSKNFHQATGTADGNMYSVDSGKIMNFSSYVQ